MHRRLVFVSDACGGRYGERVRLWRAPPACVLCGGGWVGGGRIRRRVHFPKDARLLYGKRGEARMRLSLQKHALGADRSPTVLSDRRTYADGRRRPPYGLHHGHVPVVLRGHPHALPCGEEGMDLESITAETCLWRRSYADRRRTYGGRWVQSAIDRHASQVSVVICQRVSACRGRRR